MSPLRYDSGLYVPVYREDTTRIIIGKGDGTIISSVLSLEETPCVPPSRLGEEIASDPPEGEGSGATVSCVPPCRRLEETAPDLPEGEGSGSLIFLISVELFFLLVVVNKAGSYRCGLGTTVSWGERACWRMGAHA